MIFSGITLIQQILNLKRTAIIQPELPIGFNPIEIDDNDLHWKIKAIQYALKNNFINENEPLALIYDYTHLEQNIQDLLKSFPAKNSKHFIHAMAVKSNNLIPLMKKIHSLGFTFECASFGEFYHALKCTETPELIIYDSPTKTKQELIEAFKYGAYINIDNFQEYERVQELLKDSSAFPKVKNIGIRINPQINSGYIKITSTATQHSKFGIGLSDNYQRLIDTYCNSQSWLNGIHLHVGSQGCPVALIYKGVQKIIELVRVINQKLGYKKIEWIDIGGGLPVNFESSSNTSSHAISFQQYFETLSTLPEINSGDFTIITEFGRRISTKSGFMVSRVEYVKSSAGLDIALQHAGADLFTRPVYLPQQWPLRITVLDSKGKKKQGLLIAQNIAGPLCFAGDLIAHKRLLPKIDQGDWIIIHDAGAYTFSMFSKYNMRLLPQVLKFERGQDGDISSFELIKKRENVEALSNQFQ